MASMEYPDANTNHYLSKNHSMYSVVYIFVFPMVTSGHTC